MKKNKLYIDNSCSIRARDPRLYLHFLFFSKGRYFASSVNEQINVNSKKDLVSKSLNGEIENTDDVTKIILGQGVALRRINHISFFRKKTETLYITEGMFNLGE